MIPWWGWLLISLGALYALYFTGSLLAAFMIFAFVKKSLKDD